MSLFDELRIDREPHKSSPGVKQEFRKRSWRQFFLLGAMLLVFLAGMEFGPRAPWIEVATPFVLLAGVVLSCFNWRCPACDAFWGKRWPRGRCPRCGVQLED